MHLQWKGNGNNTIYLRYSLFYINTLLRVEETLLEQGTRNWCFLVKGAMNNAFFTDYKSGSGTGLICIQKGIMVKYLFGIKVCYTLHFLWWQSFFACSSWKRKIPIIFKKSCIILRNIFMSIILHFGSYNTS